MNITAAARCFIVVLIRGRISAAFTRPKNLVADATSRWTITPAGFTLMEQLHEIQRCGNGLRLKLAGLEEAWFGAVVLASKILWAS